MAPAPSRSSTDAVSCWGRGSKHAVPSSKRAVFLLGSGLICFGSLTNVERAEVCIECARRALQIQIFAFKSSDIWV